MGPVLELQYLALSVRNLKPNQTFLNMYVNLKSVLRVVDPDLGARKLIKINKIT